MLSYSVKSLLILGFLFSWISGIVWFTPNLKIKIQRNTIFPLTIVLETRNSRTQWSLHFVEITNNGVNEQKYFHIM
jgi:hypothetical protein